MNVIRTVCALFLVTLTGCSATPERLEPQATVPAMPSATPSPASATARARTDRADRADRLPANNRDSSIIAGKRMIAQAVLSAYGAKDLAALMESRAYFERLVDEAPDDALARYYLAYCDYHAAIALMEDEDRSEPYMDQGIKELETLIGSAPDMADAWALLSSLYGLKASHGMFAGMKYGPKSDKAIKRAVGLAPNNPRVILVQGIGKFYTPSTFGGDKEKALELFRTAAAIFDTSSGGETPLPDWGHTETYTYIGLALLENDDLKGARAAFERTLSIDPEYGWVKYELLPQLVQREREEGGTAQEKTGAEGN